jgi:outer membrane protein assembly factor BamB
MKRSIKLTALIACLFIHQLINAQWPQWRGQFRDGTSSETNLLKTWPPYGPKLIWTSDTLGDGFSSAIIQDKVIYATGKRDTVEIMTALDMNGNLIWQKKIGKASKEDWPQSRSTPTFYKGKLYSVTVLGEIACMDSKTGALDWKISIPKNFGGVSYGGDKEFCESSLVVDDKVIISPCGKNTTLAALNYATGETVWTTESLADTNGFVSPVLIQGKDIKLIVTSTRKHILAVDVNTGKIVWNEKTSSSYDYIPLPIDKKVYFSNSRGNGKLLNIGDDLNSFTFQWYDTVKVSSMAGTVRIGNHIYGSFLNKKGLFCLDLETGKIVSINKEISYAIPIVADGMLYAYEAQSCRVCLIKPNGDNTDLISSFKTKSGKGPNIAHLSMAEGTLFVRHGKSLMAYDVKQQ